MTQIRRFKKLPLPVNVVKYDGTNEDFIVEWSNIKSDCKVYTPIIVDEIGLAIVTLEGTMRPKVGDYVVQGPMGEFWFVNGPIFEETYEEIFD